jgi:hypothetical protein
MGLAGDGLRSAGLFAGEAELFVAPVVVAGLQGGGGAEDQGGPEEDGCT